MEQIPYFKANINLRHLLDNNRVIIGNLDKPLPVSILKGIACTVISILSINKCVLHYRKMGEMSAPIEKEHDIVDTDSVYVWCDVALEEDVKHLLIEKNNKIV